jgi:hypothetical protein
VSVLVGSSTPPGATVADRSNWSWPLLALLGVFLATRLIAHLNGVQMDLTASYQWQLVEPQLLETRLAESLWNLHSQPPLFNALHGLVLKAFASAEARVWAWETLQFGFGLVILFSLYGTLRLLDVGRVTAAVLTALFCCSPAALAYENFLSYTYFDAALMSVAVFSLVSLLKRLQPLAVWGFFGAVAMLCLTRSAYHLLWLAIIAVALWVFVFKRDGAPRASVMAASVLSLLLVGGLYAKNFHVFHFAGASSWMGMNLATMTHTNLPDDTRQALRQAGEVSDLVAVDPFQKLSNYPAAFHSSALSGVPVLDRETRFDGSPNFNHRDFIGLSKQYGQDAAAVAKAQPAHYAKSVMRNVVTFLFRSAADYPLITGNVERMKRWDIAYSVLALGQFGAVAQMFSAPPAAADGELLKHLSLQEAVLRKAGEACLLLAAMLLLLAVFCVRQAWSPSRADEQLLFLFVGLTLGYVFSVTMLANLGEAQRMRFEVEPLLVVLLGVLVRNLQMRRATRVHQ